MGANRYSLATVAYGVYLGAGAQWRNVLPGWDLGWDVRYADNIQRDHLLPSDPPARWAWFWSEGGCPMKDMDLFGFVKSAEINFTKNLQGC